MNIQITYRPLLKASYMELIISCIASSVALQARKKNILTMVENIIVQEMIKKSSCN